MTPTNVFNKVRPQIIDENGIVLWIGEFVNITLGDSVKWELEWPPKLVSNEGDV